MSFQTRPVQKPTIQEIDFSDRLQRIKRAYDNCDPNGQVFWRPDRKTDILELKTIRYKNKYPKNILRNISWMYRIAIPKKDMFELDKVTGELDHQNRVKEALVYALTETVDNPNIEEGPVGYSTKIGWYQAPVVRYQKHDDMGNGIDPIVERWKNIFYIEFKPETVDQILSEMDNEPNSIGVSVANEYGERWSISNSVHSMEEFKNIDDIYGLIEASKHGYLRKDPGGYKEFIDARDEAKKQLKPVKVKKRNNKGEIEE